MTGLGWRNRAQCMHAVLERGWMSGQQWRKHVSLVLKRSHGDGAAACHASARAIPSPDARPGA